MSACPSAFAHLRVCDSYAAAFFRVRVCIEEDKVEEASSVMLIVFIVLVAVFILCGALCAFAFVGPKTHTYATGSIALQPQPQQPWHYQRVPSTMPSGYATGVFPMQTAMLDPPYAQNAPSAPPLSQLHSRTMHSPPPPFNPHAMMTHRCVRGCMQHAIVRAERACR